jgi:beta-1,2-mannosidase
MKRIFLVVCSVMTLSAMGQKLPDWCLGPFERPRDVNPVLSPDTIGFAEPITGQWVGWQSNDVFNPAAVLYQGKIVVLYRAEDKSGEGIGFRASRIGHATSSNGIDFIRKASPVLYPQKDSQFENEWPGGCEDPRVAMTEDGLYVMLYTQWNRKLPRLGVATSRDLVTWEKHGPAFEDAYNGKFFQIASKSASIITKIENNQLVIAKINGKYWMYWGEHHVYAATSDNLLDWQPVIEKDSTLRQLISPRKKHFDSHLTECGPPAVMTDKGIVLLYNGKNLANEDASTEYTLNSYCAGQVMFDRNDPLKPIARLDKPFMIPEAPFEKSGQYPAGTVFLEGLVYKEGKWFLYYGCADSRVAVATWTPPAKQKNKSRPKAALN